MADVEFFGERFALRTGEIDEYAVYEFAEAVSQSAPGGLEEMASIRRLLREQCIVEEDWGRFWALVREKKAKTLDYFPVIQARMAAPIEEATDRPTVQPSDSSDGPTTIEPKSGTSSVVTVLAERFPGRPDLWLGLADMAEAKTEQKTG